VSQWIEGSEYTVPEVPREEVWVRVVAEIGGVRCAETTVEVPPLCEEPTGEEGTTSPDVDIRGGRIEVTAGESAGSEVGAEEFSRADDGVYTIGFAPTYPEDFDSEASPASNASSASASDESDFDEGYYVGCSFVYPSDSDTSQDNETSILRDELLPWEGNSVTPPATAFVRMLITGRGGSNSTPVDRREDLGTRSCIPI
jgi:hypothetical protein